MKRSTAFLTVFATLVCILALGLVAWPTTPIWTLPAVCNPSPGVIKRADWIACVQALAGEDSRAQPVNATTISALGTAGRLILKTDSTPTNTLQYDDGSAWNTLVTIDKAQALTNKTISIGVGSPVIAKHLSNVASLTYSAWAGYDCQDKTIGVTGAADSDTVTVGIANALASVASITWHAWVSSSGVVSVRGCKVSTGSSATPSAAFVRVDVWQH